MKYKMSYVVALPLGYLNSKSRPLLVLWPLLYKEEREGENVRKDTDRKRREERRQ